ncbi:MAG: hybrid sensor histidine kinase/response regulator, partial [Marinobacter sp. 34-60-7]
MAQLHSDPQAPLEGTDDYLARLEQTSRQTLAYHDANDGEQPEAQAASPLVQLFLGEGLDIVLDAEAILDRWAEQPTDRAAVDTLRAELNQLTQGAKDAGLADVADLAGALTGAYSRAAAQDLSPDTAFFATVRDAHEQLINLMDQVAAGLATESTGQLIEQLDALAVDRADDEFSQQFTDDLEAIDLSLELDELEPPVTDSTPPLPETSEEASDDSEMDEELAAIFLEEARDLVDSTAEALQSWSEDTRNLDILRLLQRDLHTLKGGARLADIPAVGDLSHELENLFEGLTEQKFAINDALSDLLFRCHDRLAGMVDALESSESPRPAPDLIAEIQQYVSDARGTRPVTDIKPAEPESDDDNVDDWNLDETDDIELTLPTVEEDETPESAPEPEISEGQATDLSHLDSELVGIFLEEAYDLINSTGSALHTWSEDPSDKAIAAELQRDVHTLKGGARMAGVDAIGDLTHVLEDLFERVTEGRMDASPAMVDLLFACHDRLAQMVDQVATQKPCPSADELVERVQAILRGEQPAPVSDASADTDTPELADDEAELSEPLAPTGDDNLIGIFLDEGLEIHEAMTECLAQWREDPDELAGITRLQQELHTLKGGARLSDVDPIADLAEAWSNALEPLISGGNHQAELLALSTRATDQVKAMLSALEEGNLPAPADELISDFQRLTDDGADTAPVPPATTGEQAEALDPEVLEIFLEEAGDILDQLEHLLDDWRKEPANHHFNQEAQRALHTLKGGARLSQLSRLGDQAHAFETRLIDLGGNAPKDQDWQAIGADHDAIVAMVTEVRTQFEAGGPVVLAPQPEPEDAPIEPEMTAPAEAPAAKAPESDRTSAAPAPSSTPAKPAGKARTKAAEAQRNAQESIRVSAPLLDELVNLAGETSITRGRLEQQNSDFSHTLDEMAATIERLREQLRRMDIETEAQILFRAEQEHGPDYGDDFDPLEMDRYSSIQQLSRALTESTSDLADLRETLTDRVRDTETLLVQQSRINTELQEGLMKTRMIPFASMVPRLRRIVRQISGELGKKVEFDVRNAEGEMDRNILERMIAPLEHMLRNALDHGIETPADRKKAGKPEIGEVVLSLTREGGDVVLRMMDDGKGIPSAVIRDKAIRQGLLGEKEELSEREILQFILQPGFSTAEKVTQISGRGVGMDVVASEIKQLGGGLDIDSALGRGTTFTVRLPFTVSVNRALMVSTGEDFYAIPLNTIEGIV